MSKDLQRQILSMVKEQEERLALASSAIDIFRRDTKHLDPSTKEYRDCQLLLQKSMLAISKEYMELAISKAKVGIVGNHFVN